MLDPPLLTVITLPMWACSCASVTAPRTTWSAAWRSWPDSNGGCTSPWATSSPSTGMDWPSMIRPAVYVGDHCDTDRSWSSSVVTCFWGMSPPPDTKAASQFQP